MRVPNDGTETVAIVADPQVGDTVVVHRRRVVGTLGVDR
jgi:hypothetical protein